MTGEDSFGKSQLLQAFHRYDPHKASQVDQPAMLTMNFRHLKVPSPTYPTVRLLHGANDIETDERWGEKRPSYPELHSKFGSGKFRDVQNWITHHPNPKSAHLAPPLEDHWEDRPATYFFLLGSWSGSSLPNLLKHEIGITFRIQRNKGNAGHKNVITLSEGK